MFDCLIEGVFLCFGHDGGELIGSVYSVQKRLFDERDEIADVFLEIEAFCWKRFLCLEVEDLRL